jgi:hypothetical protein
LFQWIGHSAIAVIVFCGFFAIVWYVTRGWRELSKSYRHPGIYSGRRYYLRTGNIAGAEYGLVLIVGGNREGAYFSTLLPSRLCPPLLIPWADLTGIERRGLTVRHVELSVKKDVRNSNVVNYVSANIADKLEALSEGAWSYKHSQKKTIFRKDDA